MRLPFSLSVKGRGRKGAVVKTKAVKRKGRLALAPGKRKVGDC